jgi:hypothetical protein
MLLHLQYAAGKRSSTGNHSCSVRATRAAVTSCVMQARTNLLHGCSQSYVKQPTALTRMGSELPWPAAYTPTPHSCVALLLQLCTGGHTSTKQHSTWNTQRTFERVKLKKPPLLTTATGVLPPCSSSCSCKPEGHASLTLLTSTANFTPLDLPAACKPEVDGPPAGLSHCAWRSCSYLQPQQEGSADRMSCAEHVQLLANRTYHGR